MGEASVRRIRRTAALVASGVTALGVLTALPPAAWATTKGAVQAVTPHNVDNNNTFALHVVTEHAWLAPPSATASRTADASDKISASDVAFDADPTDPSSFDRHRLVVTIDFHQANPGNYSLVVSGPSTADADTADSCSACVAVASPAPTVTSTSPDPVGADAQYPNWALVGTSFARGPYTPQCSSLPCPTDRPNIAILLNGAIDPTITLGPSSHTSNRGKLWEVLNVAANAPVGTRTVVVTNSDGQSGSCACLHVIAAAVATSVTPQSLAPGQSGQTLIVTGHDFPSDSVPSFRRHSDGKTGDVQIGSYTWVSPTQIRLDNVAIPASAPKGDEDLNINSPTIAHTNWTFPGLFVIGAPGSSPTPAPSEGSPTNAHATPGDKQAVVQWTPPPNTSANPITGYVVRTLPSGSPSTPAPPSASSATVGPLENGTAYQFVVRVTYQSGHSYDSAPTAAVTPAGAPSAPRGVFATAGDRSAKVSWSAPAQTNGAPLDSYTVTSSPGGKKVVVLGSNGAAPATSTTVTGLTNGTAYTFTVTAHNRGGTSPQSATSNTVVPTGTAKLTIKGPYAVDKGRRADLHGLLTKSNGKPIGGATLVLKQRHSGAHDYRKIATVTTGPKGHWSYRTHRLFTTTRFRVRFAGAGYTPVRAGRFVRVRETGRITSPDDGATVSAGTVTVRGVVSSPKGLPVDLQIRRSGHWRIVDTDDVRAHHRVVLHVTLKPGTTRLRLLVEGAFGTIAGHSKVVTLTVA